MDLRRMLIALVCLLMLSACGGETYEQGTEQEPVEVQEQDEIEEMTPSASDEVLDDVLDGTSDKTSDDDPVVERMDKDDYLPEVFPEWCREDISTWDTYPRAMLTDGSVIIVPDMKLTDLPQSFRDTLTCSERGIYAERTGNLDQRAENALYAVYQTDDLQFTTVYYDPEQSDQYEDAGVEYVREVIALSNKFCTYQGARLGVSSVPFLGSGRKSAESGGTPYMEYSAENDIITGLHSRGYSDMDALMYKEISLLRNQP